MDERSRKTLYIIIWVVIATLLGTIYGSYVTPYKTHLVFGATYMTMNNPFYEVINNELRLSLIHISEPTRRSASSRMPSSA